MGNTVLTYLRKIKHPEIVRRVVMTNESKWYQHNSFGASNFRARRAEDFYEFALEFKSSQEIYYITLRPTTYSMGRKCVDKFYDYVNFREPKVVADLYRLEYNDFEATIFQHSLLGELGMFGTQEAEMLLQLRNIYFGECDESTS